MQFLCFDYAYTILHTLKDTRTADMLQLIIHSLVNLFIDDLILDVWKKMVD